MREHNSKHDVVETLRKAAVFSEKYDLGEIPSEFRDAMRYVRENMEDSE